MKIIEELAFEIGEELTHVEEYKQIGADIRKLQDEISKKLPDDIKKAFNKLCDMEAFEQGVVIDHCCKQAFLQGIELGRLAKKENSCVSKQSEIKQISIREAAFKMGKTPSFVRVGLQSGKLPFGTAIKTSSKWSYYINPAQFNNYIGDNTQEGSKEE